MSTQPGLTPLGKILSFFVIIGLLGLGGYVMLQKSRNTGQSPSSSASNSTATAAEDKSGVIEPLTETPRLPSAAPFVPKDNIVAIELSEYAGYAGLIAANGGMEPNEQSFFFQKYGFKVKLSLSEEESWPALNSGKLAAAATTADVLAAYGRQFQVVVPAQIGFSRGADGVIVTSDIKRINALKGKVLATSQFTEADFFLRYLSQEAGMPVKTLSSLDATPSPDAVNVVYCSDAFAAGDLFLAELKSGRKRLAGCVTWAPKTTEVVDQSGGKAIMLTSNRNLLIIADILVVNRGFAEQQPKMLAGLVHGLVEGNRRVREDPDAHLDLLTKTFKKWDRAKAKAELEKVHLANLPESQAFFSGAIDAAGSFGGIYQSAVYAYGSDLIKDPADPAHFLNLKALDALQNSGEYASQQIAIAPMRGGARPVLEDNPLLSRDIRFYFEPNSTNLDMSSSDNLKNLEDIKRLLQVSPGSTIRLRGHVDNTNVPKFRAEGADVLQKMALAAMELSRNRALEVKKQVVAKYKLDGGRLETVGRGWEEPAGKDPEKNRRVEVQWFTLE